MVKTLMASTAGLSSLARPTTGKSSETDPKLTNQKAEDDDDKDKDKDKDKDDDNSKKSKKAKKAEGDDDDDDDDKNKDDDKSQARSSFQNDHALVQHGAALERKKIKAVLASEAGSVAFKANPDKVMRFLTSFQGSQEDAIATLELLGPTEAPAKDTSSKSNLRERMAESDVPQAGPDLSSSSSSDNNGQMSASAAMIIRADRMRRGEKVE